MPIPRLRALVALGVTAALAAGACSSSPKSSSSATTGPSSSAGAASGVTAPAVVKLGFTADMQVPDPDIFYEIEGNAVMTNVYEGLVQYANNSSKIVAALATSWEA